jgi:hypothetical protein
MQVIFNVDDVRFELEVNGKSGTILSNLRSQFDVTDGDEGLGAALDAVESMVLAQACAGIQVTSGAYAEALRTVLEKLSNEWC